MERAVISSADDQEIDSGDAWLIRAAEQEIDGHNRYDDTVRVEDELSFEDSERFEEDSLCSWFSDPESLNLQNWRGWHAVPNTKNRPDEYDPKFGDRTVQFLKYSGGISSPATSRHLLSADNGGQSPTVAVDANTSANAKTLRSLVDLAARVVARHYSFIQLESCYHAISLDRRQTVLRNVSYDSHDLLDISSTEHFSIPDKFFLNIVRWCFPESEDDVRLYSCLANGTVDEFDRGQYLYHIKAVADVFQIGYHISAVVSGSLSGSTTTSASNASRQMITYNVSVRVDRCRIISCSCSCASKASWCQHVVALCLFRIHKSNEVEYRVTVWDSINELSNKKLKKLAQFLINELPRQYLPVAQRLIDQLREPTSEINAAVGAPDPTDGGHQEVAIWCLDQGTLHENIHRILEKFSIPSPTVHCDVQYLSSTLPQAASEFSSLLRSHRSKEPEGLWNFLSIVREMFRRRDENATSLLHIITEECLANSQVLVWWYQTTLAQSGQWALSAPTSSKSSSLMSNVKIPQLNCASLCDEIVQLWRLAALNPRLSAGEREQLENFIQLYHRAAVERLWRIVCRIPIHGILVFITDQYGRRLSPQNARFTANVFPGFLRALKACHVGWNGTMIDSATTKWKNTATTNPTNSYGHGFASSPVSSPNIPILRQLLRGFEGAPALDANLHFLQYTLCPLGSRLPGLQQTTSRKKRKRISRFPRRRHENREVARHPFMDLPLHGAEATKGPEPDAESGESEQESDDALLGARVRSTQNGDNSGGNGTAASNGMKSPVNDIDEVFAMAYVQQSAWDVKFARCEALMSHGYVHQACRMAVALAEEMMRHPPCLLCPLVELLTSADEQSTSQRYKKRWQLVSLNSTSEVSVCDPETQMAECSQLAENVLDSALFLVQVLMKEPKTCRLAFVLALSVLELPRSPAATKFHEVKLHYLESELVILLRRIEIGVSELQIIRDRAMRYIANATAIAVSETPRVLPIALGHYILDALSFTHNLHQGRRLSSGIVTKLGTSREPCDEDWAVEVALAALGMKLVVSEADFPMLCESTRRLRGELALTMLLRYKDSSEKLALILDKLLDPSMHRMYKDHPSNAAYFLEQDITNKLSCNGKRSSFTLGSQEIKDEIASSDSKNEVLRDSETGGDSPPVVYESSNKEPDEYLNRIELQEEGNMIFLIDERRFSVESIASTFGGGSSHEVAPDVSAIAFHATPLRTCLVSMGSSNSPSPPTRTTNIPDTTNEYPSTSTVQCSDSGAHFRHNRCSVTDISYRRKPVPVLPNQASEAQAHCMMELAKRLLIEAGGSQNTVIFNATQSLSGLNNSQRNGPHRQLLISSFLIGLYALGLNNLLSPSWQTRTYSTNVSWIHGQAMEIGSAALKIVERVWEAHLTPTEVAALADKASQSRDPSVVEAAADLALCVLPKAYALTAAESQKALHQCKEQNALMLEKACRAVEEAAHKDGVYPEVLFKVAHHWFELFLDAEASSTSNQTGQQKPTASPPNMKNGQVSVQCSGIRAQPLPFVPQNYLMPVNRNPHQAPGTPPLFIPPVTSGQQQLAVHFPSRGPVPVNALPLIAPVQHLRQQISTIYPPPPLTPVAPPRLRQLPAICPSPNPLILHPPVPCSPVTPQVTFIQPATPTSQASVALPMPSPNTKIIGDPSMAKLVHAHRIGMKAMETMGNRNMDDSRSYVKYSPNPAYADDVRWLFTVAVKLGGVFIQSFCEIAARTITSPFILFSLAVQSSKVFQWPVPISQQALLHPSRNQIAAGAPNVRLVLVQNGFALPTADLMQRCVEMFYAAAASKLSHPRFLPADVEDVVLLVKTARDAFFWIPGPGKVWFDDFIRHVRKQKACKKDVAQRINAVIQNLN